MRWSPRSEKATAFSFQVVGLSSGERDFNQQRGSLGGAFFRGWNFLEKGCWGQLGFTGVYLIILGLETQIAVCLFFFFSNVLYQDKTPVNERPRRTETT